jgi:branched-chain amino acid transport system substrate-binding protein
MKASKAAGLKAHFATVFLDQPGNISNAGDLAVGHYVAHVFNAEASGAEGDRFVADYTARIGHAPVFVEPQTVFGLEIVADALKRTKPVNGALDVNAFAKTLEGTRLKTPGGEISVRAADHQALMPMVVSVVSKDARYKADGTAFGFKPVKAFTGEEASTPAPPSCKMQRPD